MWNGALKAQTITLGEFTTGGFIQNNGIVNATGINLGWISTDSHGTYELHNGELKVQQEEYIGAAGKGEFTHYGGSNTLGGDLYVGTGPSSKGTYTLKDGSLEARSAFIGKEGQGDIIQENGSVKINEGLNLGVESTGIGTYDLKNGQFSAKEMTVGDLGSGTFTHDIATVTVQNDLRVGNQSGGTGTYDYKSGHLFTGNLLVGVEGIGKFYHRQDSVQVTNDLKLGVGTSGDGTYSMTDGYLTAKYLEVGGAGVGYFEQNGGDIVAESGNVGLLGQGTFNQVHGSLTFTGDLTIGSEIGSQGEVKINDGSLKALNGWVGQLGTGTLFQSHGTVEFQDSLRVGSGHPGVGTYEMVGGSLKAGYLEVGGGGTGTMLQDHAIITADSATVGYLNRGEWKQTNDAYTKINDHLTVAAEPGSQGNYELHSGTFETNSATIGRDGSGRFMQSHGTVTVTDFFKLGENSTGSGTFESWGGDFTAGYLEVGGAGTGTLNQPHSNIKANWASVGVYGGGIWTQTAGTTEIKNELKLGVEAGSQGTYTLNGGSLIAGNESIGFGGTGAFVQTGGSNSVTGDVQVGLSSGSVGEYHLSDTGALSANYLRVGMAGIGQFTQNEAGTSVNVRGLFLGWDTGSQGTYKLSDGSITIAENIIMGSYYAAHGFGHIQQSGGNINTTALSMNSGSLYEMTGGKLTAFFFESIGDVSPGIFKQSGGMNQITISSGGMRVDSDGTYELSGTGYLKASQVRVGYYGRGTFIQTGGTSEVTTKLTLAMNSGSTGTYNLSGGVLTVAAMDVNAGGTFTQSNGTLTSGDLSNRGQINLNGGSATVNGATTNEATGHIGISAPAVFNGDTTNYGTVKTTGTTVTWNGTFTNAGAYISDPSTQSFAKLTVESTGYLKGGAGDTFIMKGDFINQSTQNTSWNTTAVLLKFSGGGDHRFLLAGKDLGPMLGYFDNFAWGALEMDLGNTLLLDGTSGHALYVGEILGLTFDNLTITNIFGHGLKLYHDFTLPENAYLHGQIFSLADGGSLMPGSPVPLPSGFVLLLSGLGRLGLMIRRQKI